MKKILLSLAALLGLATGALAADLPSRRAPAPIVAAVPVFTWTGFYVGVNAGYGWNANDDVSIPGIGSVDLSESGFVGGAQAGYNYQIGSFVVGLEGDIQYTDLGSSRDISASDPLTSTIARINNRLDWFGTVRARAGVAFDRLLVYATAGIAYGSSGSDNFGGLDDGDDPSAGWVLGAGIEYAVTNNLTAGIEGLWVDLGRDIRAVRIVEPGVAQVVRTDGDDDFFVARAKVNFRFGTY